MTLPLGWVLLPGSEAQPTFREGGCLPNRQHPCEQFQVFFRSQQDAKNPEDLFEARQAGNAHPIKMSASKSGVLIISADVLNPGESGWKFNYSFFFPGQKIGFNVLSSSRNFDDFITSIELLSDTSN